MNQVSDEEVLHRGVVACGILLEAKNSLKSISQTYGLAQVLNSLPSKILPELMDAVSRVKLLI
jgi:hypothetical protein